MPNSLLTGVSGLVAHQRMMDVVGNNLANLNTHGFKVKRTLFSDLLYETIRPAASSSSSDIGGVNPNQVGSGVKVAQITSKFGQGNLELTGNDFDFAMQGEGFFVVSDGNRNLFSRNGAFALDRNGFLVDPTNGLPCPPVRYGRRRHRQSAAVPRTERSVHSNSAWGHRGRAADHHRELVGQSGIHLQRTAGRDAADFLAISSQWFGGNGHHPAERFGYELQPISVRRHHCDQRH